MKQGNFIAKTAQKRRKDNLTGKCLKARYVPVVKKR
jgi:hypothetical protein